MQGTTYISTSRKRDDLYFHFAKKGRPIFPLREKGTTYISTSRRRDATLYFHFAKKGRPFSLVDWLAIYPLYAFQTNSNHGRLAIMSSNKLNHFCSKSFPCQTNFPSNAPIASWRNGHLKAKQTHTNRDQYTCLHNPSPIELLLL